MGDLEARRDTLLGQLRELEDTGAKRTPEQLARERYALELEAARVLRDLAVRRRAESEAAPRRKGAAGEPAAPGWLARNPAVKGFLWGAGSIVVLGLLLQHVSRSADERQAGGSVTGDVPGSRAAGGDEEAELHAFLERNPDDVTARLALARLYLTRQDLMGVWNETQHVLELEPGEPRALSYQSLVRLAMGEAEVALEMLDQALATAPDLFDAYVHKSLVLVRLGRESDAQATMQEAARRFPAQAELLDSLWQEMVASEAAAPAGEPQTPSGEDPAAAPRPDGVAPSGVAAAPDREAPRDLTGVLELGPALEGRVAPGAVVFITVRERGGGGPPVAVDRVVVASFPMPFQVGRGHSMMGQPLPDRIHIEARIDSDGDAMTRDPGDPIATIDDVPAGSSGLRLVLR
jgi:tetratricopeptide (TPR) repeat protein